MKNSEPPFLIVEITYKSLEPNGLLPEPLSIKETYVKLFTNISMK